MQRFVSLAVVIVLLAGGFVVVQRGLVRANEATPEGATPPIPGYYIELLAAKPSELAPDNAIQLIHGTLEPGVVSEPHERPGERVNYVLSGTYLFTPLSEGIQAQFADTGGPDGPVESLSPDVEYSFTAGDAVHVPVGAVFTSRNPGPEDLVVMIAALSPIDDLATTYIPATPTP